MLSSSTPDIVALSAHHHRFHLLLASDARCYYSRPLVCFRLLSVWYFCLLHRRHTPRDWGGVVTQAWGQIAHATSAYQSLSGGRRWFPGLPGRSRRHCLLGMAPRCPPSVIGHRLRAVTPHLGGLHCCHPHNIIPSSSGSVIHMGQINYITARLSSPSQYYRVIGSEECFCRR